MTGPDTMSPSPDETTGEIAGEITGRSGLKGSRALGLARLAIALVQGLLLFGLWRAASSEPLVWPASQPTLFAPLALVVAFMPMVLLSGLGKVRTRALILWAVIASLGLALIGWHEAASGTLSTYRPPYMNFPAAIFGAAAVFIAHHLVIPAVVAGRWVADFDDYFDSAWKAAVQLGLSVGFTGLFWILLAIGAGLFKVIGIDALSKLMVEDWFSIPVTALVFAMAVHLTDVRGTLIRGVRTVVLMLLSWLLPVITVLAGTFLLALPFTGLTILWETGNATALVLAAAAAIIILINTAYQDGREDNLPPVILQWAARVAGVLLIPLILIAIIGLSLRIGQHGLTPERILAAACVFVGALYAIGYGLAAVLPFVRPQPWMKPLERTNVVTALASVALILGLFSPVLSPNRLAVNDQIKRLEKGLISAEDFDYSFLRFNAGKVGQRGLERLSGHANPTIAAEARRYKAMDDSQRFESRKVEIKANYIETFPVGTPLPEGFTDESSDYDPRTECTRGRACVLRMLDLDGDGQDEALLSNGYRINVLTRIEGKWKLSGHFSTNGCARLPGQGANDMRTMLKSPELNLTPPKVKDLSLSTHSMRFSSQNDCSATVSD